MAVQLIRGGGSIDALTPAELRDFWREHAEAEQARRRAQFRGKKRMEVMVPITTAVATQFAGFLLGVGPEEGYVWSVKLVSVTLSTSQTLIIYKASHSGDTRRPLTGVLAAATTQAATWSADQARLKHSEGLYFVAGGTGITGIYVAAWQVPAEMEAEVYD